MLVTIFQLENPELIRATGDNALYNDYLVFKVPILPAYAITNTRLDIDNTNLSDTNYASPPYELVNDTLITPGIAWDMEYKCSGNLTVYHNGVKEYSLLFPHIEDSALRKRLGYFALEADNAFYSQSWMSYCFMVSGVIEGLLYHKFSSTNFVELIELAKYDKIINDLEALLLYDISQSSNKIHPYKHKEDIPDRKKAMELSAIYDRLIKINWFSEKETHKNRISRLISKLRNNNVTPIFSPI